MSNRILSGILPLPAQIIEAARDDKAEIEGIVIPAREAISLAEAWHADREKIKYLESLLLRAVRP